MFSRPRNRSQDSTLNACSSAAKTNSFLARESLYPGNRSGLVNPEVTTYFPDGKISYFVMPGNRDLFAGNRVQEDGILPAFTGQHTTLTDKMPDKIFAFHITPL